jgi:hypothetical protein
MVSKREIKHDIENGIENHQKLKKKFNYFSDVFKIIELIAVLILNVSML